ncbi:MAG: CHC2 zinc finger domain-containing protein [Clostridia bacterium]|nr:CHC2 zinc finger domain-containing protein [Clostridia bacterium]
MNIFAAVKAAVSVKQAAAFYGLEIKRGDMSRCVFHPDKTPSMKLNDDYYYCFGCHEHGDVIDLVARLFHLSPMDAALKLADDFHISPSPTPVSAVMPVPKPLPHDTWHCAGVMLDYERYLKRQIERHAPKHPDEDGNNLLMFFESEDYIRFEPGYDATSKEMYAVYCIWCDENGFTPLKPRTVSDYVAANAVKLGVEHCNTVYSVEGRRVWGFKGIHLMIDSGIRNRLGMQKVYPDDNPFR